MGSNVDTKRNESSFGIVCHVGRDSVHIYINTQRQVIFCPVEGARIGVLPIFERRDSKFLGVKVVRPDFAQVPIRLRRDCPRGGRFGRIGENCGIQGGRDLAEAAVREERRRRLRGDRRR
jgi:hypothetical protein